MSNSSSDAGSDQKSPVLSISQASVIKRDSKINNLHSKLKSISETSNDHHASVAATLKMTDNKEKDLGRFLLIP